MGHDISDEYLRNIAIDILRLFAAFLVICIHCPFSNNGCLFRESRIIEFYVIIYIVDNYADMGK